MVLFYQMGGAPPSILGSTGLGRDLETLSKSLISFSGPPYKMWGWDWILSKGPSSSHNLATQAFPICLAHLFSCACRH